MKQILFQKKISKGSRFNQIYVPKQYDDFLQPGDIVEIRLIKKQTKLYYLDKRIKISDFKIKLVEDIFLFLQRKGIKQIFISGSFLYKIVGYNDLDIIIVSPKDNKKLKNELTIKFNQKFHIIHYTAEELDKGYKIDPLLRSMLNYSVSNSEFFLNSKRAVDKQLIRYYLMMPEDLLKLKLSFIHYIKNIMRLTTMYLFLKGKKIDIIKIHSEIKNLINFDYEDNDKPTKEELTFMRTIIRKKLRQIKKLL